MGATPLPDGNGHVVEIGSVPDVDAAAAARYALHAHPWMPSVPELPRRDPVEGLLARVLTGVEGVDDPVRGRLRISVGDPALESALDAASDAVPPPDRAAGLHAFLHALASVPARARDARRGKAAVVGPVALARALRDPSGRSAASSPAAADAVARFATRCAVALARALAEAGASPVVQLDEPGTTDDLSKDESRRLLDAIVALRDAGALVAVHDCGARRGDGALALGPDLVLADATRAQVPFVHARVALRAFLARGGSVAWGIVPTSGPMPDGRLAARALVDRLFDRLADAGVDRDLVRRRSWLSPACGLGASTPEEARAAREALSDAGAAWT